MEFNIDGAKVWDLTRNPTPKAVQKTVGFNPTPKTVQKNVGFNLTSIGVGFNPTPKQLKRSNQSLNSLAPVST